MKSLLDPVRIARSGHQGHRAAHLGRYSVVRPASGAPIPPVTPASPVQVFLQCGHRSHISQAASIGAGAGVLLASVTGLILAGSKDCSKTANTCDPSWDPFDQALLFGAGGLAAGFLVGVVTSGEIWRPLRGFGNAPPRLTLGASRGLAIGLSVPF